MIVLHFGRWNSSHGERFVLTRLYWRGWRWTPFCRVTRRYKAKVLGVEVTR